MHREIIAIPTVVKFKLYIEVPKGIKGMCGIKILNILAVVLCLGVLGINQLVPDFMLYKMFL